MAQNVVGIPLQNADDETILLAIEERCKELVNTKFAITLRNKKDNQVWLLKQSVPQWKQNSDQFIV